MKSSLLIIIVSLFIVGCQQTRLINLRNLTLVEKPIIPTKSDHEQQVTEEHQSNLTIDFTTAVEPTENPTNELLTPNVNVVEQTAEIDTHQPDASPEIFELEEFNMPLQPITVKDSTKTENKKMSKKEAGTILGIFGGISLAIFLFFAALALLGILLILYVIWSLIRAFVL